MSNSITICPKRLFKKLLYIIITLLIANSIGVVSRLYLGHDYCFGLVPMFDFDAEMNFPTFYSSFTLLFSSVLLALIALSHKRAGLSYWTWTGLAIIFLFLSMDEFGSIHERFEEPFLRLMQTTGFNKLSKVLFYAWVIPYGAALLVFAVAYAKFLFKLPKRTMILFIVAGGMYVSGALGLEILGGMQDRLHGTENLTYFIISACEEILEMLGIAVFIYALLSYIRDHFNSLTISVKDELQK